MWILAALITHAPAPFSAWHLVFFGKCNGDWIYKHDVSHLHTVSSMIPTGAASFVICIGMITLSHICHHYQEERVALASVANIFSIHCLVICPLDVMLNAVRCWWQSLVSLFLLAENPVSVKY